MNYKTVNELETFDFQESFIHDIEYGFGKLSLSLDNVTIKASNKCNRDIMDMRTNQLILTFQNVEIEQIVEEGYKLYDADNHLQTVVDDCVVNENNYNEVLKNLHGCYFHSIETMEAANHQYMLNIDSDFHTFSIRLQCKQTSAEWDKFMRKEN